jgi:ribose-phosphate pyrophosphokinase
MPRGDIKVYTCRNGEVFAQRVLDSIVQEGIYDGVSNIVLGSREITTFANTEINARFEKNMRGRDVFIVQCPDANKEDPKNPVSVNDNLMELLISISAIRRSKAGSVTAVIPDLCYSRQDRQKGREPITARLVADMLEAAGACGLVTFDLHSDQIAGMYPNHVTVDNLRGSTVIIPYLQQKYGDKELHEWVFSSADAGGAARAEHYSKVLMARSAVMSKRRRYDVPNEVDEAHILGRVDDRKVLLVDDMIDTAGTTMESVKEIMRKGALEVRLACTHAVFSGPAVERLDHLYAERMINEVIATDTVPKPAGFAEKHPWYTEVSVAPLVGMAICRINAEQSVSELYVDEKMARENGKGI